MDKAEQVKLVYPLIQEWLEDYQGGIIEYLKTCQENKVMEFRNQLVASEAFNDWLMAKIQDGKLAEYELNEGVSPLD